MFERPKKVCYVLNLSVFSMYTSYILNVWMWFSIHG